MGGFLIGTISEILNSEKSYRFFDGRFQIFIDKSWISIGQMKFSDTISLEKHLANLKNQIFNLPRKEGSKRHLFKILNDDE